MPRPPNTPWNRGPLVKTAANRARFDEFRRRTREEGIVCRTPDERTEVISRLVAAGLRPSSTFHRTDNGNFWLVKATDPLTEGTPNA